MSEKLSNNHIVKIGIVTEDLEDTARAFEKVFDAQVELLPAPEPGGPPPPPEAYRKYRGETSGDIQLRCALVKLDPVYFELVQPIGSAPSPWRDHLTKFGRSVCFVSFHIQGFEQHVELLGKQGYPLAFMEEKGFERYGYFDTLEKLGVTIELKEQIPLSEKQQRPKKKEGEPIAHRLHHHHPDRHRRR